MCVTPETSGTLSMCYSVKHHHNQYAITRTLKTHTFWQTPWGLSEGATGWWWSCPWSDTAPECETATGLWVSLVYTCNNNYPQSHTAPEHETAWDLWVSLVNICNNNSYSQTQQQNMRQQQVFESCWWTSVIITITHNHIQHQNVRQQQVSKSFWLYICNKQLWSDSSKMQDSKCLSISPICNKMWNRKRPFITRHSKIMWDNMSIPRHSKKCKKTSIPGHSNKMQDGMSFIIRHRNKMWDNTSFIIKMKGWEQQASINQSVICFMSVHSKVTD